MQFNTYLKRKTPFLAILGLLFGLSSCGSYQYVGVANDGIYGSSNENLPYEEAVVEIQNNSNSNGYYKNYFREKSLEYENLPSNDILFTDIDSYENDYYDGNDPTSNNYQGYAGWGQNNSNVTINVHPNYGYNNFWWNAPFYNNWGFGWNNFGYYNSFWDYPYAYGGFYNNWSFYNPYRYYGSFGHPYHYGYYGNNTYGRRGVSYNAGRRSSLSSTGNTSLRRTSSGTTYNSASRFNTSRRSTYSTNNSTTYSRNSSGTRINSNTSRRSSNYNPSSTTTQSRSSSRSSDSSSPSTYNRRSESSNSGSYSRSSSSNGSSGSSRSSSGSSSRRRG